ncbi:hypothetical protein [Natroniella sp. ANB-PHB2]|uniref:hypothetical protein n=1 Tax=Natroniella sp. ANB-PHB2 TaxID=3384444 RepID=UPI0038D450C4
MEPQIIPDTEKTAELSYEFYNALVKKGMDREVAASLTNGYTRSILDLLMGIRLRQMSG